MMDEIINVNGVRYKRFEESTPKYAVGDWVKVIANKSGRLDKYSYVGDIVKIISIYDYGYYTRHGKPVQAYSIGGMQVVCEDELEPAEEPKQYPFDINDREWYYYIKDDETIDHTRFYNELELDVKHKKVANACKDETLMKQQAMRETLNRLLWRASVEAGEPNNPWDGHHLHISINCESPHYILSTLGNHTIGCIYFPSVESAEKARENIVKPFLKEHPDFVW